MAAPPEESSVPGQSATLIKDIHSLLAQEPALTPLAHVEDVLTAGYAHALALEAQQLRLERRLRLLARDPGDAAGAGTAVTSELTEQLGDLESELSHLRTVLVTLRDRVRALRAA
jgi:hypothetical protein